MTDKLLDTLIKKLDAPQSTYAGLDAYYDGCQPLSFLSPEARTALGDRLHRVSVNVPRLLVEAVAERLRVVGFDGADVWPAWLANDMDQRAAVVHREALCLGTSYVAVWGNLDGSALISAESAKQVTVLLDPGTRRVVAAVKRWNTDSTTEATLWEPHQVTRLRANTRGATTGGLRVVDTPLPNPLGVVPVVPFVNATRMLDDDGRSEMADVLSLTDAVVKLTSDLLVSSEYTARPRRFATGIELESDEETGEAVNPIPEGDRAMVSENHEAKFGQLPGSDLVGYENAIGVIMRQISAVSGLPEHMLGIGGDNPTSADSIRASEAALTARAEARQQAFGRSWEEVMRLAAAVAGKVAPGSVDVRVRWADAATRSVAQEADAAVKLVQAGVLPASYALRKLGYSEDEITEIRQARRVESVDALGVDLGQVVTS
ncbi:phage portal protein [Solicola gregarius]|uniref:Phage portal protein n=1 Tax=Solicola gregarius TaxID=2908642 RepID=A0AA46TIG6_9ACTN|nr:phage portal protein [Solicola gregarius]UYM05464.1 phage portal protein [Solicola gregarius]